MTSARSPEDQTPDTFGGPDPGGREDELAGPGEAGEPDSFGGPDPGGREDELAGPGPEGADTLGGPDHGDEDILHEE